MQRSLPLAVVTDEGFYWGKAPAPDGQTQMTRLDNYLQRWQAAVQTKTEGEQVDRDPFFDWCARLGLLAVCSARVLLALGVSSRLLLPLLMAGGLGSAVFVLRQIRLKALGLDYQDDRFGVVLTCLLPIMGTLAVPVLMVRYFNLLAAAH